MWTQDFWHGNPKLYQADRYNGVCKMTMGELYARTVRRQAAIEALGYTVITLWESDFDNMFGRYKGSKKRKNMS